MSGGIPLLPLYAFIYLYLPCTRRSCKRSKCSFQPERRASGTPASYLTGPELSSDTWRNSFTTVSFHILSNSLFRDHQTTRRYIVSDTDGPLCGWLRPVHEDMRTVRQQDIQSSNPGQSCLWLCAVTAAEITGPRLLRTAHKSRTKQMNHGGWVKRPGAPTRADCCHGNVLPTGSAVQEVSVVLQCCQWMVLCSVCRYVHVTWDNIKVISGKDVKARAVSWRFVN